MNCLGFRGAWKTPGTSGNPRLRPRGRSSPPGLEPGSWWGCGESEKVGCCCLAVLRWRIFRGRSWASAGAQGRTRWREGGGWEARRQNGERGREREAKSLRYPPFPGGIHPSSNQARPCLASRDQRRWGAFRVVWPRRRQRRLPAPRARPSHARPAPGVTATPGQRGSDPGPPEPLVRAPGQLSPSTPEHRPPPRASRRRRRPGLAQDQCGAALLLLGGVLGLRALPRLPALGAASLPPTLLAFPGLRSSELPPHRPAQDGICPRCLIQFTW
ncbi:uncharacterized protein LOC107974138 [Pan troglodytes]|uniref:uncharacterized protein LOC107974138 n=1 Tax=Pan troglodytes TaxID=9598 RepID=UPI0023F490A8|nr:uncharacterized protein LOC107974138 [Pan troglodytes]